MNKLMSQRCIKPLTEESGAAVVEFAMVVPLLLVLVFGIIEFSILFYDKAVITNASREVAREFAVHNPSGVNSAVLESVASQYTQDRMINLDEDSPLTLTTVPSDPTTKGTSTKYVVARVNYTYDFVFLPGLLTDLLPSIDLSAETTMRNESYEPPPTP